MEIEFIIKSVAVLLVLLFLLILFFVLPKKRKSLKRTNKKKKKERVYNAHQVKKEDKVLTFDELRAIVRKRSSTTIELEKVVDQVIKNYNKIPPKRGIRSHPEFDKYIDLMMHLVRHRNTNKHLILKLDRALIDANPEYKVELNDTLSKALNSLRG